MNAEECCTKCMLERDLFPLLENEYFNKIEIIRTLKRIMDNKDVLITLPIENKLKFNVKFRNKLTEIEDMIIQNHDVGEVLGKLQVFCFTFNLERRNTINKDDRTRFLKGLS